MHVWRAKCLGKCDGPVDAPAVELARFKWDPVQEAHLCPQCGAICTTPRRTWLPTPGNPYTLEDIQPMRDRLLVAPLAVASRTLGGLHMPETSHQRERPQHGIVLRTGPGKFLELTGGRQALQAKPGDCVFYGKYSGQQFELGDQTVLNMAEIEVFAILPAGSFVLVEHERAKDQHLAGDYCDLCATPEEKAASERLVIERERLVAEQRAKAEAGQRNALPPEFSAGGATTTDVGVELDAKSALERERELARQRRRDQESSDAQTEGAPV